MLLNLQVFERLTEKGKNRPLKMFKENTFKGMFYRFNLMFKQHFDKVFNNYQKKVYRLYKTFFVQNCTFNKAMPNLHIQNKCGKVASGKVSF